MNRKYALPAAIALAAHALIFFVGSGKPPPLVVAATPPRIEDPKPNTPDSEKIEQLIELVTNELKSVVAPSDEGDGGRKDEIIAPPGTPDIPHGPVDIDRPTQDWKPSEIGKNPKIPARPPGFDGDEDGSGSAPRVFNSTSLDETPATRYTKEPIYPYALKSSGTTGTVWVEFLVDENGRVHDVKVVKSTHRGFDDATVTAVSQWRFVPGRHKGIPVRFRMSVPVVFNLSD